MIMNGELGRTWKDAVVAYTIHVFSSYDAKKTKTCQDNHYPSADSNPVILKTEAAITTVLKRLVERISVFDDHNLIFFS
jgi:hypothetical protein